MEMDTDAIVVANVNINWSQMNSLKFMGSAMCLSLSVRTVLYPFTLVRTRLQNQDTNRLKVEGYDGMKDAFIKIYNRNGLRGLYDGFSVNCFSIFQQVLYIGVLEYTRERAELFFEGSKKFSQNTIKHNIAPMMGAFCATSTLIVSVPTDVVSQYLQDAKSDGSNRTDIKLLHKIRQLPPNEKVVVHVIKDLWKTGGIRAFYKGFGVTYTLGLFSGIFWPIYFSIKGKLFEIFSIDPQERLTLSYVGTVSLSAGVSCFFSSLVSNPFELIRNQSQMHQQSAWKTGKILWKSHGGNMFLIALKPRLLPLFVHCMLALPLLEQVKIWSAKQKNKNL